MVNSVHKGGASYQPKILWYFIMKVVKWKGEARVINFIDSIGGFIRGHMGELGRGEQKALCSISNTYWLDL